MYILIRNDYKSFDSIFQEPGALPFSPKRIRSQFQHVFIIVRALNPCTENTQYSVSVSRSKEVPVFGPPVPAGATFSKGKHFADFILAKVINAENAAHRSEKFATMATRTRQEYLKDLANNYSLATIVETGQKFCKLLLICQFLDNYKMLISLIFRRILFFCFTQKKKTQSVDFPIKLD